MRADRPMATSTPALVTSGISRVVEGSVAISVVAMSMDVLEKVTTRVSQLVMKRIRYLRHLGRE